MPFVKVVAGQPQQPVQIPSNSDLIQLMDQIFVDFDKDGFKGNPKDLANFMRRIIRGIDPLKLTLDYILTITQIIANVCTIWSSIYNAFDSFTLAEIKDQLKCMNELTKDQGLSREYLHQQHIDHAQWFAALSENTQRAIYQLAEQNSLYPVPQTKNVPETKFKCSQFIKSTDPRFKRLECGDE